MATTNVSDAGKRSWGQRIGWLWPHGLAEFGFDTRFGTREPQLWAFTTTVGPRLELQRTDAQYRRSATVISVPASVGFSIGDGVRPEVGLGFSAHYLAWAKH